MRTIKFEKMLTDLKKTIDRKEIDLLPPYVFSGEVKVIEEARQVGEAADFLSRHACLGFDTETRPAFRKGEIYKVSLLQLAVPDQVFLFRLNKCGFQPALVRLLASPRIIKIGVGIRDDNRNLRKLTDFTPASFVDLQEYAGYFGIEPSIAKKGLMDYAGIPMRQQINHLAHGIKVIDDTYNASPASVKSGVDVLMQLDNPGRKIAVLGDILELGDVSWQCHYDTGAEIAEKNLQIIVTVGQEMKALAKAVIDSGAGIAVCSFDANKEAIQWLLENVSEGDAILVKGSRGMHEEEVVKALRERYGIRS